MSNASDPNPYYPPRVDYPLDTVETKLNASRHQLDLDRMVRYVFQNPSWLMNLLYLALCNFIPIVGPIVMMGYQYDIIESLCRHPNATYPNFDFNNFVDYLKRGIWPFLAVMVGSMLFVPVIAAFAIGGFVGASVAGSSPDGAPGPIMAILMLVVMGTVFALGIVMNLLMLPLQLRAGLAQDFVTAFDFGFIKRFATTIWKEAIIGMLFLMVVGLVCALGGMLVFCVGVYLTMGIVVLAQAHWMYQLYEIFLTRGGPTIPMKLTPRLSSPPVGN